MMSDFVKAKIAFAVGLLASLLALHLFLEHIGQEGYVIFGVEFTILQAYTALAALLGFSVYSFAFSLLSPHRSRWAISVGNFTYGLALTIPLIYTGLYAATLLARPLSRLLPESFDISLAEFVLVVLTGVLSFVLAYLIGKGLNVRDRVSSAALLEDREVEGLGRASELLRNEHYDLAVVKAWNAVEARLGRLENSRWLNARGKPLELIEGARAAKILTDQTAEKLTSLLKERNAAAHGLEPVTKEQAQAALETTREVLTRLPVGDPLSNIHEFYWPPRKYSADERYDDAEKGGVTGVRPPYLSPGTFFVYFSRSDSGPTCGVYNLTDEQAADVIQRLLVDRYIRFDELLPGTKGAGYAYQGEDMRYVS